jgi:hypothetical protein
MFPDAEVINCGEDALAVVERLRARYLHSAAEQYSPVCIFDGFGADVPECVASFFGRARHYNGDEGITVFVTLEELDEREKVTSALRENADLVVSTNLHLLKPFVKCDSFVLKRTTDPVEHHLTCLCHC